MEGIKHFVKFYQKMVVFFVGVAISCLACAIAWEINLGAYFIDIWPSQEQFYSDFAKIKEDSQKFSFFQEELRYSQKNLENFCTNLSKNLNSFTESMMSYRFRNYNNSGWKSLVITFLTILKHFFIFPIAIIAFSMMRISRYFEYYEYYDELNPLFSVPLFLVNFILHVFIFGNLMFEEFLSNLFSLQPVYVGDQKLPGGLMYIHVIGLVIRLRFWIFCLIKLINSHFSEVTDSDIIRACKGFFTFILFHCILYKSFNPNLALMLITVLFFFFLKKAIFLIRDYLNFMRSHGWEPQVHKYSLPEIRYFKKNLRLLIIQLSLVAGFLIFFTIFFIFIIMSCSGNISFRCGVEIITWSKFNDSLKLDVFFQSSWIAYLISFFKKCYYIFTNFIFTVTEFYRNLIFNTIDCFLLFLRKFRIINYLFDNVPHYYKNNEVINGLKHLFNIMLDILKFNVSIIFDRIKMYITQMPLVTVSLIYCFVLIFINFYVLFILSCFYVNIRSILEPICIDKEYWKF